ncbi:hypothetical protein Nepgr_003740 [Nepenthes gracilis]|uniref:IST1 homolog n=1 Tax=Nepenthes gracilis TaxID=150966 RepID=A0AAD3S027_NEPGR|nr:hypothetical protein Nepgr_003740 [Nepenthes gracilis]
MSVLNQLFNRGLLGARCKTCLTLAISRIKLLQNRRDVQLKQMRKEIAQFLQTGQEAIARIRVEHVIREQNIWAAYEILEMFCELVLARIPILDSQRECPSELQEAIASIIFSAPRCSDLPDLLQIRNLFTAKYGKEFVSAVSELRPDASVNRTIIEKLSVSTPSTEVRLKLLKEIAQEYDLAWDSSQTEVEFNKKHEDLLDGSKRINGGAVLSEEAASLNKPHNPSLPKEAAARNNSMLNSNLIEAVCSSSSGGSSSVDSPKEKTVPSSDALDRARAAMASAERATAAARAAAQLVNVKFGSLKLEEGKS